MSLTNNDISAVTLSAVEVIILSNSSIKPQFNNSPDCCLRLRSD